MRGGCTVASGSASQDNCADTTGTHETCNTSQQRNNSLVLLVRADQALSARMKSMLDCYCMGPLPGQTVPTMQAFLLLSPSSSAYSIYTMLLHCGAPCHKLMCLVSTPQSCSRCPRPSASIVDSPGKPMRVQRLRLQCSMIDTNRTSCMHTGAANEQNRTLNGQWCTLTVSGWKRPAAASFHREQPAPVASSNKQFRSSPCQAKLCLDVPASHAKLYLASL